MAALPSPADFAPPPDEATRARWLEAERSHRPSRLASLRARMAAEDVPRQEHSVSAAPSAPRSATTACSVPPRPELWRARDCCSWR